jgi:nucleoside phosphorylase
MNFDLILVPQGQEYQSVYRGFSKVDQPQIKVVPIPIFATDINNIILKLELKENNKICKILVLGLAGSLSEKYQVGDIVIYQEVIDKVTGKAYQIQPELIREIQDQLEEKGKIVRGLTSDRLIWSAQEKQQLGQETETDVVDMEGSAILEALDPQRYSVAILRVISDDCNHDLPDLNQAIAPDGSLKPLPLAFSFLKAPLAALRLIRGSLLSLKILQQTTVFLLKNIVYLESKP